MSKKKGRAGQGEILEDKFEREEVEGKAPKEEHNNIQRVEEVELLEQAGGGGHSFNSEKRDICAKRDLELEKGPSSASSAKGVVTNQQAYIGMVFLAGEVLTFLSIINFQLKYYGISVAIGIILRTVLQ